MITIEDFENLINYFTKVGVPAELKNFFEKLKLIQEKNKLDEEVKEKYADWQKRVDKLNENKGD